MTTKGLAAIVTILTVGSAAAGAAGNGGPSPGISAGWAGVASRTGIHRYVTFPQARRTLLAEIRIRDGVVQRFAWLRGTYGVPIVAFDGTTDGISADGRTMVLASTAARVTRFAVVDLRKLRIIRVVTLRGAFSFDALAPDGGTMYLIHYLRSTNAVRYHVRAYDLAAGKLLQRPVVDPREAKEPMNGSPVTRAASAGGWAYTLYGRGATPPFIHALDTAHRRAVCIDLPWRNVGEGISSVRMTLRNADRRLVLSQPGAGRLAVVDTKTYKVWAFRRPVVRRA